MQMLVGPSTARPRAHGGRDRPETILEAPARGSWNQTGETLGEELEREKWSQEKGSWIHCSLDRDLRSWSMPEKYEGK